MVLLGVGGLLGDVGWFLGGEVADHKEASHHTHHPPQQYDSVKQLRYGHLMIMTDQDHDGSHIKGLIMNFFHHFYPSLLKLPGFLVEFVTPIIKATRNGRTMAFYTMPEYDAWREGLGGSTRGWKVKYYKGAVGVFGRGV